MKKNDEVDPLEQLVRLTKLIKQKKVKVAPKGPPKAANKWRSEDPKFQPKPEKSADLVQAGGMEVDRSRQEEYENWRKDKIEEANYRRIQAKRKTKPAAKPPPPPPPINPPQEPAP